MSEILQGNFENYLGMKIFLRYYYWTKSVFLEDLTPELVAIMLSKWSQRPKDTKNATIEIMQLGKIMRNKTIVSLSLCN